MPRFVTVRDVRPHLAGYVDAYSSAEFDALVRYVWDNQDEFEDEPRDDDDRDAPAAYRTIEELVREFDEGRSDDA